MVSLLDFITVLTNIMHTELLKSRTVDFDPAAMRVGPYIFVLDSVENVKKALVRRKKRIEETL